MDAIFELVITVFATWIYGTELRPRHPVWRYILRAIAFGGAFVAALSLLNIPSDFDVPLWLEVFWMFCFVTVMSAEYYVGNDLHSR